MDVIAMKCPVEGYEDAVHKGGMSNYAIDAWHERNGFLEHEQLSDQVCVTYCARVTHVWVRRGTTEMFDHFVAQN